MRKIVIVLTLCAAACGGGDADTTVIVDTTVTTVPATTTTTPATSTTTTPSPTSTSTTSTTTTTLPTGFTTYAHELFTLTYPGTWTENPEFPGFGVGFIENHIALALPSTRFEIYLEQQEAGFDLDAHIQRLQDDLALFVPNFRVLRSGDQLIDGVRSRWFEYAEEFDGFPIVIREQAALHEDLLTTFTLSSPVEFFEFDQGQAAAAIESFRFA